MGGLKYGGSMVGDIVKWDSSDDKVRKLLSVVRDTVKDYLNALRKEPIKDLVNLFEGIKPRKWEIGERYSSLIVPIEEPREYGLPKDIYDISVCIDYLANEEVSVGAFDASYFGLGAHLYIPLLVISVGYWYYNYSRNEGGDGVIVSGSSLLDDEVDSELIVKNVEGEAIRVITDKLSGENRFVLFDESFNLTYTLSWAVEKRKSMAEKVKNNITICVDKGIIPVAVFHTRSHDLIRGIAFLANKGVKDMPNVSDAMFMRVYLKDIGSRSPLFMVYSKPVRDANLDLVGFYLKVDTHSVIRVEFPTSFKDKVDLIHSVVFSQVVLGKGFPLALQRAHDMAVITRDERKIIEETIVELLRRPSIEYILSRKELSKRWPIA